MSKLPVLLDTDPGNDIDDALAIAYLARKSECEFLGVTTVSGNVAQRAAVAEVVLRAAGREDVPIYTGRSEPLTQAKGQPGCNHYPAIAHHPHRLDYSPNAAVDFLRSTIRSRPGEIHLLSIGPMGNIGTLFAFDPEIPSLLKGYTLMAGSFFRESKNEWNVLCDPTAGAITAHHPGFNQTWIGLDVTLQCRRTSAELVEDFAADAHRPIREMSRKWFEHSGDAIFHDPLAAATLFVPHLCTYQQGTIEVDFSNGDTQFSPGDGHHRVADGVKVEAFFAEYFSVVNHP